MRVFLDTNVLASALATRGLCADVLREVVLSHTLLTSDEVEVELRRTLTGKFRVPAALADEALKAVAEDAERATSRPLHSLPLKDPADRAVVSAAINGKADLLVTGDGEIRDLRRCGGVEVVSPREFWVRLRGIG